MYGESPCSACDYHLPHRVPTAGVPRGEAKFQMSIFVHAICVQFYNLGSHWTKMDEYYNFYN